MTNADRIRKLRSAGACVDEIVHQLGLTRKQVTIQFWQDDNRERIRKQHNDWNRKARSSSLYKEWERRAQNEAYAAKRGTRV